VYLAPDQVIGQRDDFGFGVRLVNPLNAKPDGVFFPVKVCAGKTARRADNTAAQDAENEETSDKQPQGTSIDSQRSVSPARA
jgi:hypothetical protein